MIDFKKINGFEKGQNLSFEDLVCQLARRGDYPEGSLYRRVEGAGGDGGVEAYWIKPNGRKIGFQAKYFCRSREIDWSQLDKSVTQALKCHPDLERYVFALPCDLTDRTGEKGGGGTGWERWENRVAKWQSQAAKAGISDLKFDVWTGSTLADLLIDPSAVGLREYFLGDIELTLSWCESKLQESIYALDERFHPEDHVDLRIEKLFSVISRRRSFKEELSQTLASVTVPSSPIRKLPRTLDPAKVKKLTDDLESAINRLRTAEKDVCVDIQHPWRVSLWKEHADQVLENNFDLQRLYLAAEGSLGDDADTRERYDLRELVQKTWKLADSVRALIKLLESKYLIAEQGRIAFIRGSAGSGKSHLLAKCAETAINEGQPVVMVLGQQLNNNEFWSQFVQNFGLNGGTDDKILGVLDAAGKRAGVRTLLLIDAINEGAGSRYWREFLPRLIQKIRQFDHVACVVSCRAEYFDLAVPSGVQRQCQTFTVRGFESHEEQLNAARVYLDRRGIARPSTPWLAPEFVNPLFLRSICVSLELEGKSEFPPGLTGTKSMLKFYLEGIGAAITQKEQSTVSYTPMLGRAVVDIAGQMVCSKADYLSMDCCRELVAKHFRYLQPRTEPDWLSVFLNNGLLRKDPNPIKDVFADDEVVRFSFQRYQDFLMAEQLLEGEERSEGLFEQSGKLSFCLENECLNWEWIGLIDALSVLIPEKFCAELVDLLPGGYDKWWSNWSIRHAFTESIKWRTRDRDGEAFSDRSLELLNSLGGSDCLDLLMEVAVSSGHPFNAEMLHRNLINRKLPKRDESWTLWVNSQDDEVSSNIGLLIEWCLLGQYENTKFENQYLAGIVLCWLFTSSNRAIRDRATKALANILVVSEEVFSKLISKFENVDDPYVTERLLAAAFGACCIDPSLDRLAKWSELVFDNVFSSGSPPLGILLRDYALGIIELASYRSALPSRVDVPLCKPPYKSPRIKLSVSEEQLNKVSNKAKCNEIVRSCTGLLGDFSKYEIEPRVRRFMRFPLTRSAPLSTGQKVQMFIDEVLAGSSEKSAAFDELKKTSSPFHSGFMALEMLLGEKEIPEADLAKWEESIKTAENAFLSLLTTKERQRYSREISSCIRSDRDAPKENFGFDMAAAKRWIAKRAYDYGWTNDRFESDQYVGSRSSRGRSLHERIGKKYQWLALDEFLCRVADNYWMFGESREAPKKYRGPLDLGFERDIEPTILCEHQETAFTEEGVNAWSLGKSLELGQVTEADLSSWPFERNPGDDLKELPIRIDERGVRWLVLHEYQSNTEKYPEDMSREHGLRIEEFRILATVLVKKEGALEAAKLAEISKFGGGLDWCIDRYIDTAYLGEAPWRESWDQEKWRCDSWMFNEEIGFAPLAADYGWESHLDASMPEGWGEYIPAPWLAHELGLQIDRSQAGIWCDAIGEASFLNLIGNNSTSISMLRYDKFEQIAGNDYTFLTSLIAERRAWPGGSNVNARTRRVEGVCWRENRDFKARYWGEDYKHDP